MGFFAQRLEYFGLRRHPLFRWFALGREVREALLKGDERVGWGKEIWVWGVDGRRSSFVRN